MAEIKEQPTKSKDNNVSQIFEISSVLNKLGIVSYKIIGESNRKFTHYGTIWEANKNSIAFCTTKTSIGTKSRKIKDPIPLINKSNASIVITQKDINAEKLSTANKTIVLVDNPKQVFIKILRQYFPEKRKRSEIHPSAVVDYEADIHSSVYIGPYCVIGKCSIGADTVIYANVVINDKVEIKKNVVIYPGCVIGYEGFQFLENEKGHFEKFPHYGGVLIENNVEIFPLTNIDRGALSNTVIGSCTKIDHHCHIGHNVIVGKNCRITACTIIGGGTKIGDNSWIAPNSTIRDGITIGKKALVGMGAVVTKDVHDGEIVVGNPAKPIKLFKQMQKLLNKLLKNSK